MKKDAKTYMDDSNNMPVRNNHLIFPTHPPHLLADLKQAVNVLGPPTRQRWGPLYRQYGHALTQDFEASCPLMKLLLYFFVVNNISSDDLLKCFKRFNGPETNSLKATYGGVKALCKIAPQKIIGFKFNGPFVYGNGDERM